METPQCAGVVVVRKEATVSEVRVWIADLKDIQPEGTGMSMIATNQPVVSKIDHDAAMKTLRDERDLLRKALRPFAEVGDVLDVREFVNLYERWGTSGKKHTISMQHLKQASATYGVTK